MLSLSSESKTGAIISQRWRKKDERRGESRGPATKRTRCEKTNKEGKKNSAPKKKKTHSFYLQISFSVDART